MGSQRLELIIGASTKANETGTCRHPCSGNEVSLIFGVLSAQFFNGEIHYCFQPAFSSFPLLQLLDWIHDSEKRRGTLG